MVEKTKRVPKRGQYRFKFWWPEGGSSERWTERNLTPVEFAAELRDNALSMLVQANRLDPAGGWNTHSVDTFNRLTPEQVGALLPKAAHRGC